MGQEIVDYGAAPDDGLGDALHIAFAKLDAGARLFTALDKDLTAPPGSPAIGDVYLVGAAATGAWAGHDGAIAVYGLAATWRFVTPADGMLAWLADEGLLYQYDASSPPSWIDAGFATIGQAEAEAGTAMTRRIFTAQRVAQAIAALGTPRYAPVTTQAASYTLVLTDAGKWVRMNVATANNLTVPPQSDVAWDADTEIHVEQTGVGQTTIVAGTGVAIHSSETLNLAVQYAVATLKRVAADEWVLIGYLQAAP